MKLLIAIPCYNCEKQVIRVLNSLEKNFESTLDIVLIDNGSTDNTIEVISEYFKKKSLHHISLFQNVENIGLGGTHKVAFNLAIERDCDGVVICHGDDQADVLDITFMINEYASHSCSILGARFMSGSTLSGYQKSRIIGNTALNFIFSLILRRKIVDLGSGLNLFKVSHLALIDFEQLTNGFNFNVEMLLSLIKSRINFRFVPIHWREVDQVSNAKNFNVALSMLSSLLFLYLLSIKDRQQAGVNFQSEFVCSNR
jgi:glycosyltransferase involved in cell wall biosynthesis